MKPEAGVINIGRPVHAALKPDQNILQRHAILDGAHQVELGRLQLQLHTLGHLLRLALDGLREPLLGILAALAPFRLLARGSAEALAVRRRFARPRRSFRALVGDRGGDARCGGSRRRSRWCGA